MSGSATANEGWLPCHLAVESEGQLVAAAPFYLKSHSYGEFVFDHEWARAANQLGERYYPKLLGMSPFTPATGYQFLHLPDVDMTVLLPEILHEVDHFCQSQGIAILSLLYVAPEWHSVLESHGFTPRITHNYQWQNADFRNYDDFMGQFNANQRRNIKRERQAVAAAGIDIRFYTGDDIPERYFGLMYSLYNKTCNQFWGGSKYLNRRFFQMAGKHFREHTLMVVGERNQKPVGMAYCLYKGDRLFGRYWGCFEEVKFLHFSLCYYEPIAWCIEHGIRNFDPGAGGQHKIRRGFPATPNYSYHRIYLPRLRGVLLPHLRETNPMMLRELDRMNQEAVPFKEDLLPSLLQGHDS